MFKNMQSFPLLLSLALYISSLAFPGYYLGDNYEPNLGLEILMAGWLGPLDGHFAWYANFFFLLAAVNYRRLTSSSAFAFLALLLGLSFLLYNKIIINAVPAYKDINAIGLGYALWMAAIATLFVAQITRISEAREKTVYIASAGFSAAVLAGYAIYYFVGPESLHGIRLERDRLLISECAHAGEKVFSGPVTARGIYLEPDAQEMFEFKAGDDNKFTSHGSATLGQSLMSTGRFEFFEYQNNSQNPHYRRVARGSFESTRVESLESEVAAISSVHDLLRRYNMKTTTVSLQNRETKQLIASYRYTVDLENWKLCSGNARYEFVSQFVLKHINP